MLESLNFRIYIALQKTNFPVFGICSLGSGFIARDLFILLYCTIPILDFYPDRPPPAAGFEGGLIYLP